MKLQIDTGKKTIKIEESVKLDTLLTTIKRLFPNDEWKQFTLETGTVINNWSTPYIIERIKTVPTYPTYPIYPWYSNESNFLLESGTFNVEYQA